MVVAARLLWQATYADWQKRADHRREETAPAAWYAALRILAGMSPGGSGNLFRRYLEIFGPEGTFDQLSHFLDKNAPRWVTPFRSAGGVGHTDRRLKGSTAPCALACCRYPHLAAKLAYSAALTMLGRAEYDV